MRSARLGQTGSETPLVVTDAGTLGLSSSTADLDSAFFTSTGTARPSSVHSSMYEFIQKG